MTNEELVELVRAGDRDKMLDLWEQNQGIIRIMAQRVLTQISANGPARVEFDDLIQSAYLALELSVRRFEPEKGFAFTTYFSKALNSSMWRTAGFHRHDAADVAESLDAPVGDEDGEISLSDTIADPEDRINQLVDNLGNQELRGVIEEVLSGLEKTRADVIRMHFFYDMSYEEISEKTGVMLPLIKKWLSPYSLRRDLKGLHSRKYQSIIEQYIDSRTDYYATGSSQRQTSPVEALVLWRWDQRAKYLGMMWNGK